MMNLSVDIVGVFFEASLPQYITFLMILGKQKQMGKQDRYVKEDRQRQRHDGEDDDGRRVVPLEPCSC
jgi:hypothetical protein